MELQQKDKNVVYHYILSKESQKELRAIYISYLENEKEKIKSFERKFKTFELQLFIISQGISQILQETTKDKDRPKNIIQWFKKFDKQLLEEEEVLDKYFQKTVDKINLRFKK